MTLGCFLRPLAAVVAVAMQAALAASSAAHVRFLPRSGVEQDIGGHKDFAELWWLAAKIIMPTLVVQAVVAFLWRQQKQSGSRGTATGFEEVSLASLHCKAVIGRGTFGTVQLVQHGDDPRSIFALKCVKFEDMAQFGGVAAVQEELDIVSKISHACIVQFVKTFQDPKTAYFLTEFLAGGDLFNAIREIGSLQKHHTHFYAGSITLALEHLHDKSIMYRDLKPENVMLDSRGNAKLIDFGCCKQAHQASTLVGTSEYMAPECILGRTYTCAVDWWALGVMLHEFVVGPLPFGTDGQQRQEIFHEILHAPLQYLEFVSDETAASAVASLLAREPTQRLGSGGAAEVKQHAYFAGLDWEALEQGKVAAPWVPDTRQVSAQWAGSTVAEV